MEMIYERRADSEKYFRLFKYAGAEAKYHPMPHYHSSIEIFIVVRGSFDVYVDGEMRRMREGGVVFVDSFTPHTSGSTDETGEHLTYVAVVSPEYLKRVRWLGDRVLPRFTERVSEIDKLHSLLELMHGERDGGDAIREGFILMLTELLGRYCGTVTRQRGRSTETAVEIIKYIGENYSSRLSLNTLSRAFGYERTYMSRLLGRVLNMSLHEYVNRLRISEVRRLKAEDPSASLWTLASAAGFGSESAFYRAWNKYGV